MSEADSVEKDDAVFIRKRKRRCLRLRIRSEENENDNEDEQDIKSKIIETRDAQKLRNKCNGIDLMILNSLTSVDAPSSSKDDPCKLEKGGLIDMTPALKDENLVDDSDDTGIDAKFSTETNKRDEDEEMMKYIDEQMRRRLHKNMNSTAKRGCGKNNDLNIEDILKRNISEKNYGSFEDAALHLVSNNLIGDSLDNTEETISHQMLNGIPEIDLGIETKIKNIEATEEAKLNLMRERQLKKDSPSHFVPSNMAVNFVQHNRFSMEESGLSINEEKNQLLRKRGIQVRGGRFDFNQNATDDYHYEKFKRQFRRY